MAGVLTTGSTIGCGHGGVVKLTGSSKLQVSGNPVVTDGGIGPGFTVTCSLTTSNSTTQCTSASASGGTAQKLMVDNKAVMLDSVSITTNGNPTGPPTVTVGQTKLTAS